MSRNTRPSVSFVRRAARPLPSPPPCMSVQTAGLSVCLIPTRLDDSRTFTLKLESRVSRYREEAADLRRRLARLEELIAHGAALIDEESHQSQLPLAVENQTSSAVHQLNGGSPQSVSVAVYRMLAEGPTKYSDMVRRIPTEYPRIQVKSVPKSISSTLRNGMKQGRTQRLERGVYALSL